ncbi:hypothetical protein ABZ569_32630 [Streptomyces albus]|uniref:hypothetical protein n=1 Tax=Streptomyces albus TaxID=1888 RepID=UPI003407A069
MPSSPIATPDTASQAVGALPVPAPHEGQPAETEQDPAVGSVRAALERDLTPCSDCGQMPTLIVGTETVNADYPPIITVDRRCACPTRKVATGA